MRLLDLPDIISSEVFDDCISGVHEPALSAKLTAARPVLLGLFYDYVLKGRSNELYLLPASVRAKPEQVVFSNIEKGELVSIYTNQLLQKGKEARKYYDKLLTLAPLGKCPLCGFGQASTLDHFLSKARYPAYSILPCNLVPACADCNKCKGASALTAESQMPHLYFESSSFECEPWIYAEVIQTIPVSVRYYLDLPSGWTDSLKSRAENHFKELNLEKRFGVEAAAELASMAAILEELATPASRKEHLQRFAVVERRDRTNTWKAALYEVLAASDWYHSHGYKVHHIPSPRYRIGV